MDPEYEAAKASFDAAGIQPGNAEFSANEGGVSVDTPIDMPQISTTEVEAPTEVASEVITPEVPDKVEAPKTEAQKAEKPESLYTKEQKREIASKRREAEAWKKIEADRAEAAREKQYWMDVKAGRVPAPEAEPTEPVFISPHDGKKYTAGQLREVEALFLEQGRTEDAANAAKIAEHLEKTTVQAQQTQWQEQQHLQTWQQNMEYATRVDPSLLDPKNPLTQEIQAVLSYPDQLVREVFERHPHGFYLATEVAKVRHGLVSAQNENTQLKAEISKLKAGKTSLESKILPRSAPSSGRPGDRVLSEDDQLAQARAEYGAQFR